MLAMGAETDSNVHPLIDSFDITGLNELPAPSVAPEKQAVLWPEGCRSCQTSEPEQLRAHSTIQNTHHYQIV